MVTTFGIGFTFQFIFKVFVEFLLAYCCLFGRTEKSSLQKPQNHPILIKLYQLCPGYAQISVGCFMLISRPIMNPNLLNLGLYVFFFSFLVHNMYLILGID